jgi:hypothetical protein
LISTLRSYIEAMGGRLVELIAEFPERPLIVLSGFSKMEAESATRRKAG